MSPIINGSSMADLVEEQVEKELEKMHQLLLGALAESRSLATTRTAVFQGLLRVHNQHKVLGCADIGLKNQCTWKMKCRFSHGNKASDSDTEGSAAIDTKDLDVLLSKMSEVTLPNMQKFIQPQAQPALVR